MDQNQNDEEYQTWAKVYWPKMFIQESMNAYEFFTPKYFDEKSKSFHRRKRNMEKKLVARYNCAWNCGNPCCELKRQRGFAYFKSFQSE